MDTSDSHEELDIYGDSGITSGHADIPKLLKFIYLILLIWGIIWFILYWNGAWGWIDRGYWEQLQRVSNTTYPLVNYLEETSKE